MTVFENVLVGATYGARRATRRDRDVDGVAALERTGLLDARQRARRSLTLLDRKRLELARALATQPRLLLLDEIAGGLTEPRSTRSSARSGTRAPRAWRSSGSSTSSTRCWRSSTGSSRSTSGASWPRATARGDRQPEVQAVYLGRGGGRDRPCVVSRAATRRSNWRRLDAFYGDFQALFGIALRVDEGETVAIIGANGAGKSTLLQAIAGLMPHRRRESASTGAHRGCRPTSGCAGHLAGARGRRDLPQPDRAREPAVGAYAKRPAPGRSSAVYELFPLLATPGRSAAPRRSRAASSRRWRSAGR